MRPRKKPLNTHLSDHDVSICLRIKDAREALGLTQEGCAAEIGLPKSQLANYELCRAAVKAQFAMVFCETLIISEKWLATGRGSMRKLLCLPFFLEFNGVEIRGADTFSGVYAAKLKEHLDRAVEATGDAFVNIGFLMTYEQTVASHQRLLGLLLETWEGLIELGGVKRGFLWEIVVDGLERLWGYRVCGVEVGEPKTWGVAGFEHLVDFSDEIKYTEGVDSELSEWEQLIQRLQRLVDIERGTQSRLARHLGVTPQAVFRWLKGKAAPSADLTLRLLKWVRREESKTT